MEALYDRRESEIAELLQNEADRVSPIRGASRPSGRETNPEGGAASLFTFDMNGAVVQLNSRAHKSQSQANTGLLRTWTATGTEIRIKHPIKFVRGDSITFIDYPHFYLGRLRISHLFDLQLQQHPTSFAAVLDGVVDEIREDPLEEFAIARYPQRRR